MNRLETVKVSLASADQRRGRAGRLGPGICYRLWGEPQHRALSPRTTPEILAADLAPLALTLAAWGADAAKLPWLDAPPVAALSAARTLLRELEAIDDAGRITSHGRALSRIGAHPRLAHMIVKGKTLGLGATACDIAALIEERDILRGQIRDCDLTHRLELLDRRSQGRNINDVDRGALERVRASARQWRGQMDIGDDARSPGQAGLLLALAYPDRIGRRRGSISGQGSAYHLLSGQGAVISDSDAMATHEFIVAARLDGSRKDGRIFLAAPIALSEIETHFSHLMTDQAVTEWSVREECVLARRERRLGAILLKHEPLPQPDPDAIVAAMLSGIRSLGLKTLPWGLDAGRLRARVQFLHGQNPNDWPDWSEAALTQNLEQWLAPYLIGINRRAKLQTLELATILRTGLDHGQRQRLEREAPETITVPSGSQIRVDYDAEGGPALAVKLQEMFGATETPRVAGGKVPLTLHLLSPAGRPVQVTRDLAGFWRNGYLAVRADLRGRYPRHPWPDDPLAAPPTRRAKPRGT